MNLSEKIDSLLREIDAFYPQGKDDTEQFRIRILGRKGILNDLFEEFKTVPPADKKVIGQKLNEVKVKAQAKVDELQNATAPRSSSEIPDLTLPGDPLEAGARHPLSIIRSRIIEIFSRIGFTVSEGPEIEDDWHNFSALNFPPEHPARDMQDTFFIETDPDIALRTHTSSVQVRVMEQSKPPIRTISPGRVYRNEAISARANCFFHQIEGLYIDKDVSFADLKQTLNFFATEMFGPETKIRLRPSYFPFTEPSAEMDITCFICMGEGCNICKHTGWVEILGCGMVDPNVLENCGISSQEFTGFAFGMGIERIAMLKYRVKDLRIFFDNDLRFLKQFTAELT